MPPAFLLWRPENYTSTFAAPSSIVEVGSSSRNSKRDDPFYQTHAADLRSRYRFRSWESDDFIQTGVRISTTPRGFELDQSDYGDVIQPVEIHPARRGAPLAPVTDREKSSMRGVLGCGQWIGTQCCPWILSRISHLQGKVSTATVQDILGLNRVVRDIKATCDVSLLIRKHVEPIFLCWHDSSWATRQDGHSQGGFFIGAAYDEMLADQRCPVSIMSWDSEHLERVARSSGSAETQVMSEGVEEFEYIKFVWGELVFGTDAVFSDIQGTYEQVQGDTISDAKVFSLLSPRLQAPPWDSLKRERPLKPRVFVNGPHKVVVRSAGSMVANR